MIITIFVRGVEARKDPKEEPCSGLASFLQRLLNFVDALFAISTLRLFEIFEDLLLDLQRLPEGHLKNRPAVRLVEQVELRDVEEILNNASRIEDVPRKERLDRKLEAEAHF